MSVAGHVFDAAKKHPFWLLGGVAVVIVFFELRGGGSNASPQGNTGVTTLEEDPNQIAANTQLQETQAALNATTIQANDAVQMNADNIAGQEALAGIQSTLYNNYFNTAASVQNTQIAAAQDVTNKQTAAEQQVTDQANTNASTVALAGLATNSALTNEADQIGYLNTQSEQYYQDTQAHSEGYYVSIPNAAGYGQYNPGAPFGSAGGGGETPVSTLGSGFDMSNFLKEFAIVGMPTTATTAKAA